MAKKRRNNEGTIHKRKYGSWRAQITIDGERLSFTAKSYKECQEWLRATLHKIDTGLTYDKTQITFEDFLNNWLASAKASLRLKTWRQYRQISRDYILPKLGQLNLVDLRPDLIQAVYDQNIESGVGLRTIQLTHAVIRRALNRAVTLGIMDNNPANAATPPKPEPREMDIFDENQAQKLIITAQANDDRNLALYHLALTTGMRQGELLGLKWRDIDWKRKNIKIQRQLKRIPGGGLEFGPLKTKSSNRTIAVGEETISMLKEHQERQFEEIKAAGEKWQNYDLIFPSTIGTPFHPRNQYRRFKWLLRDAGLPEIRFHDLRYTAASLMLNHGVPILVVSKRLGHSKPSITLDVYGHLIPSMQEQAAEVMDEIITPIKLADVAPVAPGLHRSDLET